MSVENPIAKVRGMGSSGGGVSHWRSQRYSSLLLIPLSLWLLWLGVSIAGADFETVKSAMSQPFNSGMAIMLAVTMFYHTQLGLQVVIEDYVHIPALEVGLLLLVRVACLAAILISVIAALILVLGA